MVVEGRVVAKNRCRKTRCRSSQQAKICRIVEAKKIVTCPTLFQLTKTLSRG